MLALSAVAVSASVTVPALPSAGAALEMVVLVPGDYDEDRDILPTDPGTTPTPDPTLTSAPTPPSANLQLGSPASFKLRTWSNGVVARWNPCAVIHYRVNLKYAPVSAMRDITAAAARISSVTGMTFRYDGTTTVIPQRGYGSSATVGHYPPVIIAWAKRGSGIGSSNVITSADALGVGGSSGLWWRTSAGVSHAVRSVTGMVVMNSAFNTQMPAGFAPTIGGARGGVLLHELGHVVGLDHVDDITQEMNPIAIDRSSYGNGDVAGLRKLGVRAGCLN